MEKIVLSGPGARAAVKDGVDKGVNAIKHTAGPFGTNALIEKGNRITNDGLTILKEITLEDEVEERGLAKLKEAVAKSNDQVGDGSTTIAILVQAIVAAGSRLLGTEKTIGGRMTTGAFLKKLRSEKEEILAKLVESSTPITTEDELIRSAVVSVEDEELGRLIGSAQWELGPDGYLLAEEVPEKTTSIERVHGVRIDNGIGVSYVMNNLEKQMLEVDDVPVILTDHTIQSFQQLAPLIESIIKSYGIRKVVVVGRAFSDAAIQEVGMNRQNGIEIYPINAPYTDSKEIMLDLASILGGQFLNSEMHSLEDAQLSDIGFAAKVRARRYDAVFTGKHDQDSDKVQNRIAKLKETLAGSPSDFESKLLTSRIAQLEHGFSIVKVGAESETERKRVFDKVEDAVNAVRSAFQEGTVKGAGLAFKEIAETLDDTYILKRPLISIHEQIMANAPDDFVVEDWVRDPVKVLRIALEQAVSVAGDLSTVYTVVTTKKEKYNAFVKPAS